MDRLFRSWLLILQNEVFVKFLDLKDVDQAVRKAESGLTAGSRTLMVVQRLSTQQP